MRRVELIRFAGGAIFAHPMRSALTTLGIVIGVAAVLCMTSIGLGAQQQIKDQISGLGSNMLIVQSASFRGPGGVNQGGGSGNSLDEDDAAAILLNVSRVAALSSAVRGNGQVIAEGANWQTQIWGVDPAYLTVRDMQLSAGRMFDSTESNAKVIVIGATVAENLFPNGEDPIGQRVRVGRVPMDIIGVLRAKGQSGMGQDQDDLIIGPLNTVRTRIVGRRVRGDEVQNIFIKANSEESIERVQEEVTNLLRTRHQITNPDNDDFQIQNMTAMAEAAQASTKTFTVLLAAVAGVSLVVGGVGIMNIMLVAVTERTREIGLRMALGATRTDILAQFALEAVALSLLGGLIGLSLGIFGAFMIGQIGNWPTAVPAWAAPLSLGFSMFVGLVFGAYPSWRAAQLDPIEALRRD
jgi:putative ABC transport system permease protein